MRRAIWLGLVAMGTACAAEPSLTSGSENSTDATASSGGDGDGSTAAGDGTAGDGTSGDGDGDGSSGDGDGDGSSGDGDGDGTAGDGDGDGSSGDGDGDGSSGDGDGDGTTGDGDGDGSSGDGTTGDGDGTSGDGDGTSGDGDGDGAPSCQGIGPAVDSLGTTPGTPTLPHPTLEHVSVLWPITGDDDEDGTLTVRFRETAGPGPWRDALQPRRIPAGMTNEGFTWTNKHAGTVFGLTPDTEYELELHLVDPDGGCALETLTVRTRAMPAAAPGSTVIPVDPGSFAGALGSADPGDVLELAVGTYAGFTVGRDGAPGNPIVVRGQPGVMVTGDVRLDGRSDVIVEGLHVQGQIKFNASTRISIIGNTVDATEDGIVIRSRSEDAYIADNVVRGSTTWTEAALGASGANLGEGIIVTGPGHVIEHNRVEGFRDAISFLEDSGVDQFSLDVLRNDVEAGADDGIEADFCWHNCRILENRLTNTFIAMSSQPGLGGPTYFVRNAAYSVILSAFKLQRGSVGDIVVHNTIVKNGDALGIYTSDTFSRQWFRNNLFIGGPGGTYGGWSSGSGDVISLTAADPSVDLNYDGYGSTLGSFDGQIGATSFSSLTELQTNTTETNAVEVDLTVFETTVPYPANPFPALPVQDLRPASGGAAIDAGMVIPGLNDGYAGGAPDLGAHELGAPEPQYGPRP